MECPIISVRKVVKKQNIVTFKDGGGYIYNKQTGKKLRFVERNGVYFIKIKVLDPPENEACSEPGFARHGP